MEADSSEESENDDDSNDLERILDLDGRETDEDPDTEDEQFVGQWVTVYTIRRSLLFLCSLFFDSRKKGIEGYWNKQATVIIVTDSLKILLSLWVESLPQNLDHPKTSLF